ncbi:thiol S-methyltransferase METTL7B-like [Mercenaria mercenaria]|uniref:thiol S-methyltransferase METTL7B-like n=1 Tax=Mercenaria mercenaria TaxID=6596 RepID=UPI001E1DA6E2|nr:thiol S-methyltransferase METTL7B-like [Mercenaria mercenaria]
MAAEDKLVQDFLIYKIGSLCAISGVIWIFRDTIRYHTFQRFFAWIMNKITFRLNRGLKKYKTKVFQFVHEYQESVNKDLRILEVGAGTAANLAFLPSNTKLVCLDPNPHFVSYIKKNLKQHDTVISAEILHGYAEDMPLENDSFDVVVCTLVMCSVKDMEMSLQEIKRVLKKGGLYVFLEHVGAEKNTWRWISQCIMNPFHWTFGDGCEVKRETEKVIKEAGFSHVYMEKFYPKAMPFWCKPCILGSATK